MSLSKKPYESLDQDQFMFFSYERKKRANRHRLESLNTGELCLCDGLENGKNPNLRTIETNSMQRQEIFQEPFSSKTPKGGSVVRSSSKVPAKKLPSVVQNTKAFPRDFFAASPKLHAGRGHSAVTRSAARHNLGSLNQSKNELDYNENKITLGLNPVRVSTQDYAIR